VLNLGLANLSVDQNWVQIIKGLVLLGAVAFDVRSKMQGKRSFIGIMMNRFSRAAPEPVAAAAPVAVGATETNRSASPAAAPTVPDELPHGLDKVATGTNSYDPVE
jgi:putative multiple sugar transport system permease protein